MSHEPPNSPQVESDAPAHADDGLDALLRDTRAQGGDPAAADDVGALFSELSGRIEASDAAPWAGLRALPTGTRMGIAVALALVVAVGTLVATPRPELSSYPLARMALALGSLGVLAAFALRLSLRPAHRPAVSARTAWSLLTGAVAVVTVLALLPVAHEMLPHTSPLPHETFWQRSRACLLFGLFTGLPVLLALRALDRGTPYSPWLGAAALGLVGNLALQLHCPLTGNAHLLAGHAAVPLVAIVGLAAYRLLRSSRAPGGTA